MTKIKKKTIELWDGYEVEVDEQLFKDTEFLFDLEDVKKEGDFRGMIMMMFAVVGGEGTYNDTKQYITNKCGYFSVDELNAIVNKIAECFPKAGNRASRRQKWTRK